MKRKFLQLVQSHRQWIPFWVLAGTLVLTAIATAYVKETAQDRDSIRFQNAIQRSEDSVRNRLETYVALLESGAALFAASEQVGREEFHTYASRLHLQERYPGVQGMGFSQKFQLSETASILAMLADEGRQKVGLRPDSIRSEYHSVLYLEPLDRRNRVALGYDMFTEPTRRAAMARARDTGLPAASGKVTLVQEIDEQKQAGFLIYVPVYQQGSIPSSVNERRAKLEGFVYSPFRADDLMAGIFGTEPYPSVDLQIYDGTNLSTETLLHQSRADEELRTSHYQPRFTARRRVEIAGRTWSILFTSRPEFDATSSIWLIPYVAVGGTVVSLVLFSVTRSQIRARSAAELLTLELRRSEHSLLEAQMELERRVEQRTSELAEANLILQEQIGARQKVQEDLERQAIALQEQAKLLDLAYDAIVVRDMGGKILFWNQGAVEQYDWTKEEAVGQVSQILLQTQYPESLSVIEAQLLQQGRWDGELVQLRREGISAVVASRWALQRDEQGEPLAILEINRDMTQRKRAEQALQQSLAFEAMLKRITERVRDSLDENDILQTAVEYYSCR